MGSLYVKDWLNDSFYNTAFDGEEKAKIVTVTNRNPDTYGFYKSQYAIDLYVRNTRNEIWIWPEGKMTEEILGTRGALGCDATSDNVFCLSYTEALSYLKTDEAGRCTPTTYVVEQGVSAFEVDSTVRCAWWLRSPGFAQDYATYINHNGEFASYCVDYDMVGVRPALWISTK